MLEFNGGTRLNLFAVQSSSRILIRLSIPRPPLTSMCTRVPSALPRPALTSHRNVSISVLPSVKMFVIFGVVGSRILALWSGSHSFLSLIGSLLEHIIYSFPFSLFCVVHLCPLLLSVSCLFAITSPGELRVAAAHKHESNNGYYLLLNLISLN